MSLFIFLRVLPIDLAYKGITFMREFTSMPLEGLR